MTDKWADRLISKVRYDTNGTHIQKVLVHLDNGDSVGAGVETLRSKVVELLEANYTFCTITKDADSKWQRGAMVEIIRVNGTKYIKTVPDTTEKDNLGSLPEF